MYVYVLIYIYIYICIDVYITWIYYTFNYRIDQRYTVTLVIDIDYYTIDVYCGSWSKSKY